MDAWLVVGLGNPGSEYADTRHNIGVRALEILAERLGSRLRKVRFLPVNAGDGRMGPAQVLLARADAYMNVSGPPIASLAKRRGIEPEHLVVCHDEIDLPLGALRIKQGGGAAGHRGVESLARALGSQDFHRVRMGVGRPPGRKDAADHVLDRFSKAEREDASLLVERAADAVETLVVDGLAAAQERHNRSGP